MQLSKAIILQQLKNLNRGAYVPKPPAEQFPVSPKGPVSCPDFLLPKHFGKCPDYIVIGFASPGGPTEVGYLVPNRSYTLQAAAMIQNASIGVGTPIIRNYGINIYLPTYANFFDTRQLTPFQRPGGPLVTQDGRQIWGTQILADALVNRCLVIEEIQFFVQAKTFNMGDGFNYPGELLQPALPINMAMIQQDTLGNMIDSSGVSLYLDPAYSRVLNPLDLTSFIVDAAYTAKCNFIYHAGTSLLLTTPSGFSLSYGAESCIYSLRLKVKSQHSNLINLP